MPHSRLIVEWISLEQRWNPVHICANECFWVLRCVSTMKQTSRNNHLIDSRKCTQKTHYFYYHKPLLVHLSYNNVTYIIVFSTTSSTFSMLMSLSKHASLKWYQPMMPWTMPSWLSTISKKEDCFYMIFMLDIFIYISLYQVYRLAMTGIFGVPPACIVKMSIKQMHQMFVSIWGKHDNQWKLTKLHETVCVESCY